MKGEGSISSSHSKKEKNKIELTFGQKLLLDLLKYNREKDSYVVSENVTFIGIQKELGCNSGYLSRLIKNFEIEGLIIRLKKIIKTKKRKQCAFFLSDSGIKVALEINDKKMKTK